MTDNVMAISAGRLGLSRITYQADLRQDSGLIIPLGVIAEMTIGSWRALGLIARTDLRPSEVGAIGSMLRDKLTNPFQFLKPEFDWAFAKLKEGEPALPRLSARFTDSLFFAPPRFHEIKKVLPVGAEPILADLRKFRDEEFYVMIAETRYEPDGVPDIEDTTKLAA